jgi:putative chromate ion transporter
VGATLAGVAFVLPSFLMVLGLGWAYRAYGGLSWVQAVFYSVGAVVIGIIGHSAFKLTRKSIGGSGLLWAIYLVAAALTVVTESEEVLLFLAAGVLVWLVRAPPRRWWPRRGAPAVLALPAVALAQQVTAAGAAGAALLGEIFLFFTYAGAFVFGSGLAIVPFLYGGLVNERGWLNDQQFLDAVAVALITAGPVVITTGFIGFLLAGLAGAVVAAFATFFPAYVLTIPSRAVLQEARQASRHRRFRHRRNRGRYRRDQRRGGRVGTPLDRGPADRAANGRHGRPALEVEGSRAPSDRGRSRPRAHARSARGELGARSETNPFGVGSARARLRPPHPLQETPRCPKSG